MGYESEDGTNYSLNPWNNPEELGKQTGETECPSKNWDRVDDRMTKMLKRVLQSGGGFTWTTVKPPIEIGVKNLQGLKTTTTNNTTAVAAAANNNNNNNNREFAIPG